MMQWDKLKDGYLCPVCKKDFKSDSCSHNWVDVEQKNLHDYIENICNKLIIKQLSQQQTCSCMNLLA